MLVKYLVMTFKNEDGEKIDLTVNGIKGSLTAAEIGAAMDVIITKDAFIAKGGSLKTKVGSQIISRKVNQFKVN